MEASSVLIRSTSSTGLPSALDNRYNILSSISFSSCFILALLTMRRFLASSRSGRSSATTIPKSWSSKPLEDKIKFCFKTDVYTVHVLNAFLLCYISWNAPKTAMIYIYVTSNIQESKYPQTTHTHIHVHTYTHIIHVHTHIYTHPHAPPPHTHTKYPPYPGDRVKLTKVTLVDTSGV